VSPSTNRAFSDVHAGSSPSQISKYGISFTIGSERDNRSAIAFELQGTVSMLYGLERFFFHLNLSFRFRGRTDGMSIGPRGPRSNCSGQTAPLFYRIAPGCAISSRFHRDLAENLTLECAAFIRLMLDLAVERHNPEPFALEFFRLQRSVKSSGIAQI
jgi:hypothetical protein